MVIENYAQKQKKSLTFCERLQAYLDLPYVTFLAMEGMASSKIVQNQRFVDIE